jgi:hypothetical protein
MTAASVENLSADAVALYRDSSAACSGKPAWRKRATKGDQAIDE